MADDDLEGLRLTLQAFMEMPEYSSTFPTGTTPGKRWRRHDGAYDHAFLARGGKPRWMVCEYGEISPDGKTIKVKWYRPIVRVPAGRRSDRPCDS